MSALLHRLHCATGLHDWQQRDDPRGYSGGPMVIYKVCRRCEKQRWDEVTPVQRHARHVGHGPDQFTG